MFNLSIRSKKVGAAGLIGLLVCGLVLSWLIPVIQPKAATTTANDLVPAYTDSFRFGTNTGHRNDNFSDAQYSDLVANLGMNSFRVFLPENYLETWGYNVALSNMQRYQTNNLKNLTANLGTPSRAHSKAPASAADWQLDYYSPQNLYQPIWNADGSINTSNYWANYIYKTVSIYKPYVKIWEVWNEPDFTNNYNATQANWWNGAPAPTDLAYWNDSIFSYIRMLHVSYEVIKKVDPTAFVATGGLGYESFLDGVLRYSENPADGSVNATYPLKGGAYFDVLSYHYYPQYGVQNLATKQWNQNTDSDNAVDNLLTVRSNLEGRLKVQGYGTTYPTKHAIVTETGFSSKPVGTDAGSMDLLRNYSMKLQIMGRVNNYKQIHTFMLSDQEADTLATDSYQHMGMYYDIAGLTSTAQATRKAASYGTETVARTLNGATYDATATVALNLPANVRGAVFQNNGQRITALWARTSNNAETATINFNLPVSGNVSLLNWQWVQNNATAKTLTPVNGLVQLSLTGDPVFVIGSNAAPLPAPTSTPIPLTATATVLPTSTVAPTATPTKTATPTAVPTNTVAPTTVPATATPTRTTAPTVAPTNTPTTVAPTATPTKTVAPTAVPTSTAVPPTATPTKTTAPVVGTPQALAIKLATASGADSGTAATNLLDNNTNTIWTMSGVPAAWVQFDLGVNKQVSQLRWFVNGTDHAPSTAIQYSLDGINWTTLPNANGINAGAIWGWNTLTVSPVTARYVRFYLNNPGVSVWTLGYYGEVQIWGS